MAPEQSDGREAGEPADLYSLALVLYEALSGVNPVRGPTPAATARRLGSLLEPLERHRGDLPPGLTRALDATLDPDPERRGSLRELRDALEDARGRTARWRPFERRPEPTLAYRPARTWARTPQAQPPERLRTPSPPSSAAIRPSPAAIRPSPAAILPSSPAAASEDPSAADTARAPRLIGLPRLLWLGAALAAILWQALAGRPGLALLLLAAFLPLLALPRRAGPGWLAAALAPALGLAGIAGAYPALAGQPVRWRSRAALGALGYWWLILAQPLAGRRLWLAAPTGVPARAVWEQSLSSCAVHVLVPLLTAGVVLGAVLWALGATALPWVVRGRNATLDVVGAIVWSAVLLAAAPLLDSGLALHGAPSVGGVLGSPHGAPASPRGAVLGAALGALFAVSARALRGPVSRSMT